ncbi:acyl-CoA reductase [Flavobacterium litorale]|uniref:Acyl-CoA reductase n=1 Tax=Flavobacterium litorale TaxID=2856519 RepID=A0ABX8V6D2_9FLAO|nr:acyl-CoA reductase [Flavobacterium litorale]QYJ67673.1 acyl-CoA reductase [Flavobacterium litorale]
MTLTESKKAFITLGKFLSQFSDEGAAHNDTIPHNDVFFNDFKSLIDVSQSHNRWFTPDNVRFAIQSWAKALTATNLDRWLTNYTMNYTSPKTVGLVLAGNIPLVGFHDFLSVLITGNKVLVKTSSNDKHLLPFLAQYLIVIQPKLQNYITFTENKLENFDAVIATGSNNTARYFEYYFEDKPAIIRKNRNSVAILTGNETKADLEALGEDIFRYFGLGCRNVSKLFVPTDYNFKTFFEAVYKYGDIIHYDKYANNYDYNKAVFLMSEFKILDNEFLTLKEDESYTSPIASLFYEYYDDIEQLKTKLDTEAHQLQCIVSNKVTVNSIPFGQTQQPELWDYADNVDTIAFLTRLK